MTAVAGSLLVLPAYTASLGAGSEALTSRPRVLPYAVTCAERPKQLPDTLPWRGCKPTLRSVCEARCTPGAKGRGYRAVCSLNDGSVTWVVTGSCSGSAVSGMCVLSALSERDICPAHSCLLPPTRACTTLKLPHALSYPRHQWMYTGVQWDNAELFASC